VTAIADRAVGRARTVRSARATAWLNQHGYDAVNLDGGMVDWARAGLPVV